MKRRISMVEALAAVLQSSEGEEDTSSITDKGRERTSGEASSACEDGLSTSEDLEDKEEDRDKDKKEDKEDDKDEEKEDNKEDKKEDKEDDKDEDKEDNKEEDDDEEDDDEDDPLWKSKNGKLIWAPTPKETLRYMPSHILSSGPTRYAKARTSSPKTSFELFITEDVIQLILKNTNLQGRRTVEDWKDLDEVELWAFIGLLILAGLYRSQHEATQSLWAEHTGRAIFRATMSRSRFTQINTVLRFDDPQTRPASKKRDKLAPIRGLWNLWNARLPRLFNPGRDVCVDKQLIPFKGSCSFKRYIPNKTSKYGIQVWVVCDVETLYAWKMQVYTGRSKGTAREGDQGMQVVLEMTEKLKGHTVTVDKFFTSFPLAEELHKRKITLVGALRKNEALPPQLLETKPRKVLSSVFAFRRTQTAVSYVPKKRRNVLLLSTRHREPGVEGPKKKPKILKDYNHCKGAVDNLDKAVGTYSCRRRGTWPHTLFCNILDVSAHNAFILFMAVDPSWNEGKLFRRRLFLEELGKSIVAPLIARREHMPRSSEAATLVAEVKGQDQEPAAAEAGPSKKMRKQCAFCQPQRRVFTQCAKCKKYTCKVHLISFCSSCSSCSTD